MDVRCVKDAGRSTGEEKRKRIKKACDMGELGVSNNREKEKPGWMNPVEIVKPLVSRRKG